MKRTILCLTLAWVPTLMASAAQILVETFSYPDGPLVPGSSGKWATHSGTANQVDVASGKVNLTQAESEDVNAALEGAPYNGPTLYASFIVNFSTLPAGSGGYFAHFKDDGTQNLRARVYVTTNGAASGKFRVGIANTASATPTTIVALDLDLGTDYLLVIRHSNYNTTSPTSTLWINPGSEAATADRVDATDTTQSALSATTFALRQSTASGNGMGVLTLDDLKVGTAFNDVVEGGDPTKNPPTLSSIPDQRVPRNTPTAEVQFTVADGETPVAVLEVSAVSDNQVLVPDGNVSFGGAGANRTLIVTPVSGQQGLATITVTVKDGDNNTASRSFLVIVGAPAVSAIANQTTPRNVPAGPISFTATDAESDGLTFSFASTNETLVPTGNISLGGAGANRTVTVTPAADVSGLTRITVFVSDGYNSVSNSFVLTVFPTRGLDVTDAFAYADGSVTVNSSFTWNTHSAGVGQTGQTQVVQGQLLLSSTQSEDIHTFLLNSPYLPSEGWILYSRFAVNFNTRPSGAADYFAHFRNLSTSFGARVYATTNGAAEGKVRLGIANNAGAPSAVLGTDLDLNTPYTVVTRYNVGLGHSTLWVNPASESDAGVTATDNPFTFEVWTYAFRQSGGIGGLAIDDLAIGTAFADVVTPRPRLLIVGSDDDVQISWSKSFTGYQLEFKTDLSAANWSPYLGVVDEQGDNFVVRFFGVTGNQFFRLSK